MPLNGPQPFQLEGQQARQERHELLVLSQRSSHQTDSKDVSQSHWQDGYGGRGDPKHEDTRTLIDLPVG